ncbi:MAG TPA: PRC-barrel domain-containing protein [Stellaceae bacterium]|jgi:sporulation protein YlmC with PRC-barrel domain|nr:PRC-barrel domain-containing protein [Stellaceae bacterium]
MRSSTSKAALVALATAAFALPAFAQNSSTGDATNPPPATTASPSNPAPAPSARMDQDKSASPSARTDTNNPLPSAQTDTNNNNNSVAAAPDMGAAAAMGGERASRIIGTAVVNSKDESIGKVDDILIGPNDKATMAVISVGGFLGIGAKLVAVPFDQLQPAANDRKSLSLPNGSKEQLQSMPAFKYGRGA